MIKLFPYQQEAIEKLHSGSILCGGVGSGKSLTALAYYYIKECGGDIGEDGKLSSPSSLKDLYIITTARKRDTLEWESECNKFGLLSLRVNIVIDSWNNLHKYDTNVRGAFYIFDEQRVVGSGSWVKSFIRVTKKNNWILLSATPGDTWMDYIPVFVANGFYKNRTEFLRLHAVYNRFTRYPKVDHFVDCGQLEFFRRKITVLMDYKKATIPHYIDIPVVYNDTRFKMVRDRRWNIYESRPIKDAGETCYLMRKVANEDPSRVKAIVKLLEKHPKLIVFYNFDYELEALRILSDKTTIAEWNGHKHELLPKSESWLYLVQYTAGAEGWNCIETNALVFYSQSYSYKLTAQAAGRIDRLNTPYSDLYYYTLKSRAPIDIAISKALDNKEDFNEKAFLGL